MDRWKWPSWKWLCNSRCHRLRSHAYNCRNTTNITLAFSVTQPVEDVIALAVTLTVGVALSESRRRSITIAVGVALGEPRRRSLALAVGVDQCDAVG